MSILFIQRDRIVAGFLVLTCSVPAWGDSPMDAPKHLTHSKKDRPGHTHVHKRKKKYLPRSKLSVIPPKDHYLGFRPETDPLKTHNEPTAAAGKDPAREASEMIQDQVRTHGINGNQYQPR